MKKKTRVTRPQRKVGMFNWFIHKGWLTPTRNRHHS